MDAETQELKEKVKHRGLRIVKLEEDLEQMSRTAEAYEITIENLTLANKVYWEKILSLSKTKEDA